MDEGQILINAAQCLLCDEIIESEYRHDFKWCSCQNLAVDGGKDYLKRSWVGALESWKDMSVVEHPEKEEHQPW